MKPVTRKRLNKFQVNFVQTKKGASTSAGITTTRVHYCISASDVNPALHQSEQGNERGTDISECDLDTVFQDSGYPDQDVQLQSSYERRKEKLADGWSQLRESLVRCKIQTYGYPSSGAACVHCGSLNALVLCKDCGPRAYHCNECAVKHHSTINIMHRLMVWKEEEKMYLPFPASLQIKKHCGCSTTYNRDITCIDLHGYFHLLTVTFCTCESEAETLLQACLFPATPKHPQMVFTFALLDWLEALMFECQVSAQDFSAALGMLGDTQLMMERKRSIYPVIIDCFEEYRHIKHEIRQLKSLVPLRSDESTCPACSQNDEVYLSLDANFGLCRKKSAGNSVRSPLHSESLFLDQVEVNEFVNNYGNLQTTNTQECNQLLAGHVLRSKGRYKALDETALAGVVCRHEFPLKFFSLCHGERLSYAVFALEQIKNLYSEKKVHMLYDIACLLEKHLLKKGRSDLLNFFKLAVPIFHSYGHKVECQLKYNPRHLTGFGLTDGEGVERLWSYLRRFARMTKEMRPSHRIDILCDALFQYARKSANRLPKLLVERLKRSKHIQLQSKASLENIITASPVLFNTIDVERWYQTEVKSQVHCEVDDPWEYKYFVLLQTFLDIQKGIANAPQSSSTYTSLQAKLSKCDMQLKQIENDKEFERWSATSDIYNDMKRFANNKQKDKILKMIFTSSRERWFLLKLKAKFADGQYLASRLSQSITKETSKLKSLLSQYHSIVPEDERLEWADVTNLSSDFWYRDTFQHSTQVPRQIKLKAIEHHHLILRADEEITLVKKEMLGSLMFYFEDWKKLTDAVADRNANVSSLYANGCLHLLQLARLKCEIIIRKQLSSFSEIVSLPEFLVDDFLSSKLTFSSNDVVTSEYEEDPPTTSVYAHSDDEYDSFSEDECSDQSDVTKSDSEGDVMNDSNISSSSVGAVSVSEHECVTNDMHVQKNRAQSGVTHNVSSMVYPSAKSVQSPPYTTNRLQAPNNSRAFAMQHQQAIDVPILSAPDESESEHSDADDGFEYALRAKDRLEKAEYLEKKRQEEGERALYDVIHCFQQENLFIKEKSTNIGPKDIHQARKTLYLGRK